MILHDTCSTCIGFILLCTYFTVYAVSSFVYAYGNLQVFYLLCTCTLLYNWYRIQIRMRARRNHTTPSSWRSVTCIRRTAPHWWGLMEIRIKLRTRYVCISTIQHSTLVSTLLLIYVSVCILTPSTLIWGLIVFCFESIFKALWINSVSACTF